MDLLADTPTAYAKRLAGYIASPTKIEALTRMEFGRAPPLHQIAEMRCAVERAAKPPERYCNERDDDDGRDYVVRSLVPKAKPRRVRDYIVIEPARLLEPPENPFAGLYSTGARVIASVAHDFGLTPAHITGLARDAVLIDARAVVVKVLKRWGRRSYPEIGRLMNRDHSTVIHSLQNFDIYARRNRMVEESYLRHLTLIEEAERELATRAEAVDAA